ncbi:MAG: hypothetical protein HYV52_02400 [Parcubacteria group bacterium]|nr:hypothetical protein [Parcubacteria group bacterium]
MNDLYTMFKNLSKLITVFFSVLPLTALAAVTTTFTTPTAADPFAIIKNISNVLIAFIFAISVIVILYAAFLYVTAGGDPEATNKARTILIYGIVGIAVAALSFGLSSYVIQFFGAPAGTTQ